MQQTDDDVAGRLAELMAKVPNPRFNKKNPHFGNEYADLGEELTVKLLCHQHGFRIHQTVNADRFTSALVDNATGHVAQIVGFPFVMDKQTPQALGSALTYHRRYGIDLLFNRVGQEDDDGEAATDRSGDHTEEKENW